MLNQYFTEEYLDKINDRLKFLKFVLSYSTELIDNENSNNKETLDIVKGSNSIQDEICKLTIEKLALENFLNS